MILGSVKWELSSNSIGSNWQPRATPIEAWHEHREKIVEPSSICHLKPKNRIPCISDTWYHSKWRGINAVRKDQEGCLQRVVVFIRFPLYIGRVVRLFLLSSIKACSLSIKSDTAEINFLELYISHPFQKSQQ